MRKNKTELLAPAGDLSCLKAAVNCGADAVYFGGEMFNARKSAGNFSLEEIKEACDLCRLHGVKTNFTLNTLIKENEWPKLEAYLDELLPLGIDALIIQDMGVASVVAGRVRDKYPWVELHASTQMAVEDLQGVNYLQSLGFSRVVLARELSMEEIVSITEKAQIETEVFIHGALCYSDSGRCLLSSFHGGRSGNRGTCAQACRLAYEADGKKGLYMNLKDRCGADFVQELVKAGVSSLKIEGRMKGIPYVTAVTGFYREILDALEYGRNHTDRSRDRDYTKRYDEVLQVFNRGDFTAGYFYDKNRMIERGSVKNQGLRIGKVIRSKDHSIRIHSEKELHGGDEIEIMTQKGPIPIRLQDSMLTRDKKDASFRLSGKILEGQEVRRIVDPVLHAALRERALQTEKIYVDMSLSAYKDRPLVLRAKSNGITVTLKGSPVQEALKAPVTKEQIEKQLSKTGEIFELRGLDIDMENDIFIPVAALNSLRRDALDKLVEKLTQPVVDKNSHGKRLAGLEKLSGGTTSGKSTGFKGYQVSIETMEQLQAVLEIARTVPAGELSHVIFSMEGFKDLSEEEKKNLVMECCKVLGESITMGVRFPRAGRETRKAWCLEELKKWKNAGVSFGEANRYGQIEMLHDENMAVILSPEMGVMNRLSGEVYSQETEGFSLSTELTIEEIEQLKGLSGSYAVVYGKIPYMVSEQCIYKERYGCKGKGTQSLSLKDRQGETMTVISHCALCYSEIFSERPIFTAESDRLKETVDYLRIQFADESMEEALSVLKAVLSGEDSVEVRNVSMDGHFEKGVE